MKVVIDDVGFGEHFSDPGAIRVGHINGDGFDLFGFTRNTASKGFQRITAFALSYIKHRPCVQIANNGDVTEFFTQIDLIDAELLDISQTHLLIFFAQIILLDLFHRSPVQPSELRHLTNRHRSA
jgi:hypothetical protein